MLADKTDLALAFNRPAPRVYETRFGLRSVNKRQQKKKTYPGEGSYEGDDDAGALSSLFFLDDLYERKRKPPGKEPTP